MEILQRYQEIIAQSSAPFVIEIGACDGYHSNKLLEAIKQRELFYVYHAFEPCADLHERILKNIYPHLMFNNGVIGLFPDAVGARNGIADFYKSSGVKMEKGKEVDWYYGSSSIRKPKEVFEDWQEMEFRQQKINVVTLDTHLLKFNLRHLHIDFIWMDVQGAEIDVIRGAQTALKQVRYLYTEYSNKEHYEGQLIGAQSIIDALPDFEVVEDYNGDILLKNKFLS